MNYFTKAPTWLFQRSRQYPCELRQVVLILEEMAGASRLAKTNKHELANITGYPERRIRDYLKKLSTGDNPKLEINGYDIHLLDPEPETWVKAWPGVIHHPTWADWQKHVLLFIMSQFRGKQGDHTLLALNMYGRERSIRNTCYVPWIGGKGSQSVQIKQNIGDFIEELLVTGVITIAEPATREAPAICVVNEKLISTWKPKQPAVEPEPVIRFVQQSESEVKDEVNTSSLIPTNQRRSLAASVDAKSQPVVASRRRRVSVRPSTGWF